MKKMLNIGCGSKFHTEWINIDIHSSNTSVIQHDIRKGLPFPDCTFDAVYSSHLLEHLSEKEAGLLLKEKFRILKPGGICRIGVPDLEQICKNYLFYLNELVKGRIENDFRYRYSKLELFDQMTRNSSGGELGKIWMDRIYADAEFIQNRHGKEVLIPYSIEGISNAQGKTLRNKIKNIPKEIAVKIYGKVLKFLLGNEKYEILQEGIFRNSGEIHKVMYDRYSIKKILSDSGFKETEIVTAFISKIPEFSRYELDVLEGEVRKPDSIFAEAIKP